MNEQKKIAEEENFRAYLRDCNPKNAPKTYSFRGIEEQLKIPKKTLDNFCYRERSLGENHQKVVEFFKKIGYDEQQQYYIII